MKRCWSVKVESRDGTAKHLEPPTTRPAAWLACRAQRRRMHGDLVSVVNHDDEMRAWGRLDWIDYPTVLDVQAALGRRAEASQ